MKSVIYIDRSNLYYYGGNVHAPIAFPLPPTAVVDMEIINEKELSEKLEAWIKEHKIEPAPALLLLSHATYFQKEIPTDTPVDKVNELKKGFIDNVPFNDTLVREYLFGKSTIVVVINKVFIFALRDIFRANNFEIEAIAPITQIYGLQTVNAFSAAVAQDALKKITKESSFPIDEVESNPTTEAADSLPKENKNKRLYLMVAVFTLLLLILALVWFMSRAAAAKKKANRVIPTAAPVVRPTATASDSAGLDPTPSITTIERSKLTIQVLNGSGIAGQADKIKTSLEDQDFDNITTGNAPSNQSARTLIIFKPAVATLDRDAIKKIVEALGQEVSVQDKSDTDVDVLITTSKPVESPTP